MILFHKGSSSIFWTQIISGVSSASADLLLEYSYTTVYWY